MFDRILNYASALRAHTITKTTFPFFQGLILKSFIKTWTRCNGELRLPRFKTPLVLIHR